MIIYDDNLCCGVLCIRIINVTTIMIIIISSCIIKIILSYHHLTIYHVFITSTLTDSIIIIIIIITGLREIVKLRPRDLLDYLLPTLMTTPVTITSAKALGSIMSVAGPQLHNYFSLLIPSLTNELSIIEEKVDGLKNKINQQNSKNGDSSSSYNDNDVDNDANDHEIFRLVVVLYHRFAYYLILLSLSLQFLSPPASPSSS